MARPRFSVQILLLAVTFVGLCLACWNAYFAWYKRNHAAEFISNRLSVVRNGDSVEHVCQQLGVVGVDIDSDSTLGPRVPEITRQLYANRPDGLRTSDQLLTFHVGNAGVTLQFRDGVLVNHDSTDYTKVGSAISLRKVIDTPVGEGFSKLLWQMGPLQVFAGIVAGSALFAAIALAKRRSYEAVAIKLMITLPVLLGTTIVCASVKLESVGLGCVIVAFMGGVAWSFAGYVIGAGNARTKKSLAG